MIAAWMLYCVAIGLALTVVGLALDRGLYLAGRPIRWAWVVALAGSFVIPTAAWLRPEAFSTVAVHVPPVAVAEPATVVAPLPAASIPVASAPTFSLSDLDGALRWGWGVSSVVLLCGLCAAALRLAALRRRWRTSLVDGRVVLVSENIGPAVAGLWRPEVIVPDWALALREPQRRLMLSHEEEHVRAADPWLLACGAAALVLMPWNPALWWQVRRLRLAVEIDCDARVLARGGTTPEYGELLLQVGRRRAQFALATAALGEPVSFLERRIRRMATALPRWRWAGAAAALAIAAGAIVGACEAPRPVEPAPVPEALAPVTIATLRPLIDRQPAGDTDASEVVARVVRESFPELLRGREEPVYIWVALDQRGHPVAKGTSRRALGSKMVSTEMRSTIIPDYNSVVGPWPREYGAIGYGVLAPNSPPVLWVRFGDKARADADVRPASDTSGGYYNPTRDHLERLARRYHPEAFVNPRPGTAVALVFDARDSVVGHAAGGRTDADRSCNDVVKRLLPEFRYRRFRSAGCADAAGPHGPVVVYWGSLRRR